MTDIPVALSARCFHKRFLLLPVIRVPCFELKTSLLVNFGCFPSVELILKLCFSSFFNLTALAYLTIRLAKETVVIKSCKKVITQNPVDGKHRLVDSYQKGVLSCCIVAQIIGVVIITS